MNRYTVVRCMFYGAMLTGCGTAEPGTVSRTADATPSMAQMTQVSVNGDSGDQLMTAMQQVGVKPPKLLGAVHLDADRIACTSLSGTASCEIVIGGSTLHDETAASQTIYAILHANGGAEPAGEAPGRAQAVAVKCVRIVYPGTHGQCTLGVGA